MLSISSMQQLRSQLFEQLLGRKGGNGLLAAFLMKRRRGRNLESIALSLIEGEDIFSRFVPHSAYTLEDGARCARLAEKGLTRIKQGLLALRKLVDGFAAGEMAADAAHASYERLSAGIVSTIQETGYRGIRLLDGKSWAGDKRLRPGLNGTASLIFQTANGQRSLVLADISSLTANFAGKDLPSFDPERTEDRKSLVELSEDLHVLGKCVEMFASNYTSQAAALEEEAGGSALGRKARGIPALSRLEGTGARAKPRLRLRYGDGMA